MRWSPLPRLAVVILVLLGGTGAVAVTAANPAVQLSSVAVTPDDPNTGERVTIEATISNLENSDTTVEVTDLYVRTPGTTEEFARGEDVGSIAPGGTLSVPVSTTFETAGQKRLDVNLGVRDEDGEYHSYIYPVYVDVSEPVVKADLSATTPGNGSGTTAVTLTNFGNTNLTDVEITAVADGAVLDRNFVHDVPPDADRTTTFDTGEVASDTVSFTAAYDAAGGNHSTSLAVAVDEDTPVPGEIRLTAIEVSRAGPGVTIQGDAARRRLGSGAGRRRRRDRPRAAVRRVLRRRGRGQRVRHLRAHRPHRRERVVGPGRDRVYRGQRARDDHTAGRPDGRRVRVAGRRRCGRRLRTRRRSGRERLRRPPARADRWRRRGGRSRGRDHGLPVAQPMTVVALDDAVKRYRTGGEVVEALAGVDFRADRGEMVTVIGPSGSGKSTMLNLVGLLDTPSEGTVRLDGRDVTDFSEDELTEERRSEIGFVFQAFHLLPMLTAAENVELPSMWDTTRDRSERAVDLLGRVGLDDRLEHTPEELSGGQKQRVAIARALINEPDVLLADEPTGNLDQDTGRTILDELTRLKRAEDVAIVAVTHDEQLVDYADRVVRLVDGVVQ
jgi:putative ABC transport system ATP-binding protein